MQTKFKLAIAVVAMMATPAMAQYYGGISLGKSNHKQNQADWSQAGSTSTFSDKDTGYKIFGGYSFNQNFAVEGGYTDLGKYTANITNGASAGQASVKTNSWNLFGVGTLPLGNDFSVFAKLGMTSNYSKMSFASTGGAYLAADSGTKRKSSVAWGLGGSYAFNKNISARLEYEDFGNAGEDNGSFTLPGRTSNSKPKLISLGLVYAF